MIDTEKFNNIVTSISNKIGIITLNTPENYNVLSSQTFEEIKQALFYFEKKEEIKVILFNANCAITKNNNKIFSAGVNLKDYNKKFEILERNPQEFKENLEKTRNIISYIEEIEKPVIAAVEGLAIGGAFEIIMACDLIILSKDAKFQLSEINIGLIPGYGGISRLLRMVEKNKTFEVLANAKVLTAKDMLNLNIASEVFDTENFMGSAINYCSNLAKKSLKSLYLIKDTINKILKTESINKIEVENFMKAVTSQEAKEQINSFFNK